jgi:hypothetical protein
MSNMRARSGAFTACGDVGGHSNYGSRRRADGRAADREGERAFEDDHKRIEGRRVLTELLVHVKREEREIASSGSGQPGS